MHRTMEAESLMTRGLMKYMHGAWTQTNDFILNAAGQVESVGKIMDW